MKIIHFDEKNIIETFDKGMESKIYLYNDNGNTVLLKKLIDYKKKKEMFDLANKPTVFDEFMAPSTPFLDKNFLENKEKKLEIISSLDELKNEIEILDKVYDDNDNFIGYTMKKCPYRKMDSFDKRKDKIKYLKLLKEKIEILNSKDIYIGDYNQKNFLVSDDNSDVKLCDLDNFKVLQYDFDTKSVEVQTFNRKCNNEKLIDCFCFNIFTLSCLLNVYKPYLLYYLRDQKIPPFIKTDENIEIINSMIKLDDSYQKKYLIDNIK